jgi:hypothetical protein
MLDVEDISECLAMFQMKGKGLSLRAYRLIITPDPALYDPQGAGNELRDKGSIAGLVVAMFDNQTAMME